MLADINVWEETGAVDVGADIKQCCSGAGNTTETDHIPHSAGAKIKLALLVECSPKCVFLLTHTHTTGGGEVVGVQCVSHNKFVFNTTRFSRDLLLQNCLPSCSLQEINLFQNPFCASGAENIR